MVVPLLMTAVSMSSDGGGVDSSRVDGGDGGVVFAVLLAMVVEGVRMRRRAQRAAHRSALSAHVLVRIPNLARTVRVSQIFLQDRTRERSCLVCDSVNTNGCELHLLTTTSPDSVALAVRNWPSFRVRVTLFCA